MVVYQFSRFMRVGDGDLFIVYNFLLFRTKYVRYLMAFWCILFMRILMISFGIFSLVRSSMECSCIALLALAVIVMRGLVFHPLFCMVLISGSYLVCLCMRTCSGNMSRQDVNSMSWTMYCTSPTHCDITTLQQISMNRLRSILVNQIKITIVKQIFWQIESRTTIADYILWQIKSLTTIIMKGNQLTNS